MSYSLTFKKNDSITFGKYKGRSIEHIMDIDPSYVLWLIRETDHKIDIEEDVISKMLHNFYNESPGRIDEDELYQHFHDFGW